MRAQKNCCVFFQKKRNTGLLFLLGIMRNEQIHTSSATIMARAYRATA